MHIEPDSIGPDAMKRGRELYEKYRGAARRSKSTAVWCAHAVDSSKQVRSHSEPRAATSTDVDCVPAPEPMPSDLGSERLGTAPHGMEQHSRSPQRGRPPETSGAVTSGTTAVERLWRKCWMEQLYRFNCLKENIYVF